MIRLAANLSTLFCELPLSERFAAAASAGFDAVELQFPYAMRAEELGRALRHAGLKLVLINAPAGDLVAGERGLALEGGARFEHAMLQARDTAIATGCCQIHVLVGKAPGGLDDETRRIAAGHLRWAAALFAQHNIDLLLEALNPSDQPDYALPSLAHADALRREIELPNVRLQFDAFHAAMGGGDPAALLAQYLPVTGHIQIASVPHRTEPDTCQMQAFLNTVEASGYGGFVGCEYTPRQGTFSGLGWAARYGITEKPDTPHCNSYQFEIQT